jgi:hypothetical protein
MFPGRTGSTGCFWDGDVPEDAPMRPGTRLPLQNSTHLHYFVRRFFRRIGIGGWLAMTVCGAPPMRPQPSKHLSVLLCQVFARHHAMDVPVLLFVQLLPATPPATEAMQPSQWVVSWSDAGRAVACALRARPLPEHCEVRCRLRHVVCYGPSRVLCTLHAGL